MSDLPMDSANKPGANKPGENRLRGRHVLFALLGFFGTIIAVNAVFIFLALDTWTGLTTRKSYVEGLNYNSTIRAAEEQRERGWNAEITVARQPGGTGPFEISIAATLRDRAGTSVSAGDVTLTFRHPMNETFDRTVTLAPHADGTGENRFTGTIHLPAVGNWDTRLTARMTDDTAFRQDGSLWIGQGTE